MRFAKSGNTKLKVAYLAPLWLLVSNFLIITASF